MTSIASRFACRRASSFGALALAATLSLLAALTGRAADSAQETTPATSAVGSSAAPASSSIPLGSSSSTGIAKVTDTYKIQPQDILVVEVTNEPSIGAKELRVTARGEISFPYIGAIKVAGRTPADVQDEIKSLLEADYLVDAQVIAQVKEYRKRTVMVLGQVNRAGAVEIPPEGKLSVIEAIAGANGYTRYARKSDIEVSRAGQKSIRCSDDEQRNNPDKAIYLEDKDVVFVHESRI